MRKNKPYREWYAESFCANRSLVAISQSLESANELLSITIRNLLGTGNSPSELYKMSSKLESLNRELRVFYKQMEGKIEDAEKKHELRKRKRQYENIYLSGPLISATAHIEDDYLEQDGG